METPGRILIIKPDEVDVVYLTSILQSEGYICTLIQDEIDKLKAFEINEYDLAIIEIQTSNDKGLELIQTIQKISPGMPIMICTPKPSMQLTTVSIQSPVAVYLNKPGKPSVLLRYVKSSIATYKALKWRESLLERTLMYAWGIEETIQVLEATRSSFKSKKLAALRRQLERIFENEQNEIRSN